MTTRPADLSLYMFRGCPYCLKVTRVLDALDVDVELRDIHASSDHALELAAARGRQTVPVLRIERPDGSAQWMPESADIAAYLADRFGDGEVPRPTAAQRLMDWRVWALAAGIGFALARGAGWV